MRCQYFFIKKYAKSAFSGNHTLFQPLSAVKADEEDDAPEAEFDGNGGPVAHKAHVGNKKGRKKNTNAPHAYQV